MEGDGPTPPTVRDLTTDEPQTWRTSGPGGAGALEFVVFEGVWYLNLWSLARYIQLKRRGWGLRRLLGEDWPFLLQEPGCLAFLDFDGRGSVRPFTGRMDDINRDTEQQCLVTRRGLLLLLARVEHPYAKQLEAVLPGTICGLFAAICSGGTQAEA